MSRLLLIVITLWSAVSGSAATTPHVEAELVSEVQTIRAGQPFWVALRMRMLPHWHTYWLNPGDSGLPTKIEWRLPEGFRAGSIQWPAPEKIDTPPLVTFGYSDEVFLLTEITPPAELEAGKPSTISAKADWLVCREECIPETAQLLLTLNSSDTEPLTDPKWESAFRKTRLRLPASLPDWSLTASLAGDFITLTFKKPADFKGSLSGVTFYPETPSVIDHNAPQKLTETEQGFTLQLKRSEYSTNTPKEIRGVLVNPNGWDSEHISMSILAPVSTASTLATTAPPPSGSIWLALALAFLGGIILNLMPCVLPVLSIKILDFVKQAGESHAWKHGLIFTLGVLVSFWLLAATLLLLRAGGEELGWGFQLQSPTFLVILSHILFLLGLNLFGVFEMGTSLMGAGSGIGRSGWSSSFMSGALATIVATPCTGPFMGSALGFAMTQPAWSSMLIFTSLALGMASPYLLLSSIPGLTRYIPKPGAWMESFKQFMGFLMMATVVWLAWVLGVQLGIDATAGLLAGFVVAALAAWVYGRWGNFARTTLTRRIALAIALTLSTTGLTISLYAGSTAQSRSRGYGIEWQAYSPELVSKLQAEGRPVFIDFTAAWCLSCQVNERVTFSSDEVKEELKRRNVVTVKADWTSRDEKITKALAEFGRNGVPLYVIYSGRPGDSPRILPEVITPSIVLEELRKL